MKWVMIVLLLLQMIAASLGFDVEIRDYRLITTPMYEEPTFPAVERRCYIKYDHTGEPYEDCVEAPHR